MRKRLWCRFEKREPQLKANFFPQLPLISHRDSNDLDITDLLLTRPKVKYFSLRQIIKNYQNWQLILICVTFNISLQLID